MYLVGRDIDIAFFSAGGSISARSMLIMRFEAGSWCIG